MEYNEKPLRRDIASMFNDEVKFKDEFDDDDDEDSDRKKFRNDRNGNNYNSNNNNNKNYNNNNNNNSNNNRNYNNNGNYNNRDRNNNNSNNNNNRNYDNNRDRNNNNNNFNNNNNNFNNPVTKVMRNQDYDRSDIIKALTKKNGLSIMIEDLKKFKENPQGRRPFYITESIRDIIFASAISELLSKILDDKKLYQEYGIDKDDMELFMDEIVYFINNSYDDQTKNRYTEESLDYMRRAYNSILYSFSKKKMKKFKEVKGLSESLSKKLVILSSGTNVSVSIYKVLKLLYTETVALGLDKDFDNIDNVKPYVENIWKIFKCCYPGKKKDIIKYLMLEKRNDSRVNVTDIGYNNVWLIIDEIISDKLESMEKKDKEDIIRGFIKERKRQEKDRRIPRRFNKRSIHPDDYPKLMKFLDDFERKDFSIVEYLR